MYFSWTDLDEIHGEHFRRAESLRSSFHNLVGSGSLELPEPANRLEFVVLADLHCGGILSAASETEQEDKKKQACSSSV